MKITIEFKTDNAAFQDGNEDDEVYRITQDIAFKIHDGYREGQIIDFNGNMVGYWTKETK